MMNWFNLDFKKQYEYTVVFALINKEFSADSHTQATPFSLCLEMVEKAGAEILEEKDWLVISNLEFIVVLKEYFKYRKWDFNRVSFVTPCAVKKDFAIMALGVKNVYEYSDIKNWKIDMKFDRIIGNPPYVKGLHMKILEKSYEFLEEDGELLFIHPSTKWLRPPKNLPNYYKDIVSLDFRNGVELFGAKIWVPISITHIKKNSNQDFFELVVDGNRYITTIDNISIHGLKLEFISLKEKIKKNKKFIDYKTSETFNFYYSMGAFGGHCQQKDMYYMSCQKGTQIETDLIEHCRHNFGFNTLEEAQNCEDYLRSQFAMRCLSLVKINQHIEKQELSTIPYLDFTQKWTDEKIYKFFNLSQEEINFVEEVPKHPLR